MSDFLDFLFLTISEMSHSSMLCPFLKWDHSLSVLKTTISGLRSPKSSSLALVLAQTDSYPSQCLIDIFNFSLHSFLFFLVTPLSTQLSTSEFFMSSFILSSLPQPTAHLIVSLGSPQCLCSCLHSPLLLPQFRPLSLVWVIPTLP